MDKKLFMIQIIIVCILWMMVFSLVMCDANIDTPFPVTPWNEIHDVNREYID